MSKFKNYLWFGVFLAGLVVIASLFVIDKAPSALANSQHQLSQERKNNAHRYLTEMTLSSTQANYIIEKAQTSVKDPDHFVSWFGAIYRHEQWADWFHNWKSKYLAWRLKKWMEYKPFWQQMDWWIGAYNKYRAKHQNTYGWLTLSRYCVSDYHWWKWAGCPNWQAGVPKFRARYWWGTATHWTAPIKTQTQTPTPVEVDSPFDKAQKKQDQVNWTKRILVKQEAEAVVLWGDCIASGECNR